MHIPRDIRIEVLDRLRAIEAEKDVAIFYACESGSRAWGFESKDSDYDVRFLYAHPEERYFSIDVEHRRDVIERPINDELDLSGWDLRKALQLMRKSNPPLLEWLTSPYVYSVIPMRSIEILRDLVDQYYSPTACLYHYYHMARGNFRDYLQDDVVWTKKYFYVLRPLFAMNWIRLCETMPPMEFEKVMDLHSSREIKREVQLLLERKRAGHELGREPKNHRISRWIRHHIEFYDDYDFGQSDKKPVGPLNDAFRQIVRMLDNTPQSSENTKDTA